MPEIITRKIGLYFCYEDLEIEMKQKNLSLEDYNKIAEFLYKAFHNNEFEEFGFSSDDYDDIDDITGDSDGITMTF